MKFDWRRVLWILGSSLLLETGLASTVFNIVSITPENIEEFGFEVTVVTSSTNPPTGARILFPANVKGIWAASSLEIVYRDDDFDSKFVQKTDIENNKSNSISFLLDEQSGTRDVTAIFTYSCIDEHALCRGWSHRQYYFNSILVFDGL